MNNTYLGSLIQQKMSEKSMSIQDFSDKINCHRTTVYDIFRRKSMMRTILFTTFDIRFNKRKKGWSIVCAHKKFDKLSTLKPFLKRKEAAKIAN
jgi:predicted transcriptional regulator